MTWLPVTNRTCRRCGASSEIYCECDLMKTHESKPLCGIETLEHKLKVTEFLRDRFGVQNETRIQKLKFQIEEARFLKLRGEA